MSTATYPITGLQEGLGPNGSVPLRYELSQFVNPRFNTHASDQLNLFLQALERMQNASRTELLSWFQISGIHGQPFVDWDNAKAENAQGTRWLGYCTHSSILFPTWHRVYNALIEQAIHKYMKEVVSDYPPDQQTALKPALDNWRMPYWDWALPLERSTALFVPELMRTEKVEVRRPTGLTESIDNPLYRYKFPLNSQQRIDGITNIQLGPREVAPFAQTPYTLRHPVAYDVARPFSSQSAWAQGISDNSAVAASLNNGDTSIGMPGGKQLVTDVYRLFAMMRRYPPFSNTSWNQDGTVADYQSLEQVHNNVHVFVGGLTNGHMTFNNVAAFDPAFWMHHGNVDRLFAIFQALNPQDHKDWPNDPWISRTAEPWFTGRAQEDARGTWTTTRFTRESTTSPLTPFHTDDKSTYWNSDGCRDMKALGYSYDDLRDWDPKYHTSGKFDEALFCSDIRASLVQKYGWALPPLDRVRRLATVGGASRVPATAAAEVAPAEEATEDKEQAELHVGGFAAKKALAPKAQPEAADIPVEEREFDEYVVNVRVDRFAVEGQTFVINIFLGDVPESALTWEASATRIGVVSIFGGALFSSGGCSNCNEQAEQEDTRLVTGQVSITSALLDLIEEQKNIGGQVLESLERENVSPFLKKALRWRVSTIGDVEYDIHQIPSLKVSVAVCKATLPTSDHEFIEYGDFEILEIPTKGRLAGFDPTADTF